LGRYCFQTKKSIIGKFLIFVFYLILRIKYQIEKQCIKKIGFEKKLDLRIVFKPLRQRNEFRNTYHQLIYNGLMRKSVLMIIFSLLYWGLSSQSFIPPGPVNGSWNTKGSPYIIQGDVFVDDSLIIGPGVEVLFMGNYVFEIYGKIRVLGTVSDSVKFSIFDTTGIYNNTFSGWAGLAIILSDQESELNFCFVEFSQGTGITVFQCSQITEVRNCDIRRNKGDGLYCAESDLTLTHTSIRKNSGNGVRFDGFDLSSIHFENFVISENAKRGISENQKEMSPKEPLKYYGTRLFSNGIIEKNLWGGISLAGQYASTFKKIHFRENGPAVFGGAVLCAAPVTFDSVLVENNTANNGGGFYISSYDGSTATVSNSQIINNISTENGGGVFIKDFSVKISNTEIVGNYALNGGGIYTGGSGIFLVPENNNVSLLNNIAINKGGGVYLNDGPLLPYEMNHFTISGNSAGIEGGGIFNNNMPGFSDIALRNSIVWDNAPDGIAGNPNNLLISYCNIQNGWAGTGNINADPFLIDPENGNLQITWINYPLNDYTKSPCIDAGDPNSPSDPDGTPADMGAYFFDQSLQKQYTLDLRVFLEGPYFSGQMTPFLNLLGYIPSTQPYHLQPWNHFGLESVFNMPDTNVVDWVFVEVMGIPDLNKPDQMMIVSRQALFLMKNGSVRALDGINFPVFYSPEEDNLFLKVFHRNHLAVRSSNPLPFVNDTLNYDFSLSADMAIGGAFSQKQLAPGIWGMISGDGNADGQIDNRDKNEIWYEQEGSSGYFSGDFNMNSQVDQDDKIVKWQYNVGKGINSL
jgi:hypothetical protein